MFARCHLKDLVVELSLSLDNLNGNLLVLWKFYKETQSNRLQILDYLVVKFRRLKGHLCFKMIDSLEPEMPLPND